MHHDVELNALGLRCPLPLLRTKELLRTIDPGQVLMVVADDPQAPRDIELYVTKAGHTLVLTTPMDKGQAFYIQKR